jgi:hypothetical protein
MYVHSSYPQSPHPSYPPYPPHAASYPVSYVPPQPLRRTVERSSFSMTNVLVSLLAMAMFGVMVWIVLHPTPRLTRASAVPAAVQAGAQPNALPPQPTALPAPAPTTLAAPAAPATSNNTPKATRSTPRHASRLGTSRSSVKRSPHDENANTDDEENAPRSSGPSRSAAAPTDDGVPSTRTDD